MPMIIIVALQRHTIFAMPRDEERVFSRAPDTSSEVKNRHSRYQRASDLGSDAVLNLVQALSQTSKTPANLTLKSLHSEFVWHGEENEPFRSG